MITVARKKMTNSDLLTASLRMLNNSLHAPVLAGLPAPGTVLRTSEVLSCINPPSTAVWPLTSCNTDSISRVWICGTGLVRHLPALAAAMATLQRLGLGSLEKPLRRVMVGRTDSETWPLSLTCGVMLMTMPMGTVSAEVLKVVLVPTLAAVVVVASIEK